MRRIAQTLVLIPLLIVGAGCTPATGSSALLPVITPLSESDCKVMAQNSTVRPDNPVNCRRLSAVHFSYHSDEGVKTDGKLVVLDVVAPEVAVLMHELEKQGFYIRKSRPLEEYKGDDIASMSDNNTSAFNGRRTATSSNWSLHAYGVAIDINPVQNPAIYPNQRHDAEGNIVPGEPGTALIVPAQSSDSNDNYINRNVYRARPDESGFFRPGMAESVADLFAYHGFLTWGGYWNDPLDYQHFEVGPRRFVERMYAADSVDSTNPVNGRLLFTRYVASFRQCLVSNRSAISSSSQLRAFCARETIKQFSKE